MDPAESKWLNPVLAGLGIPLHVNRSADVAVDLDDVPVPTEPRAQRRPDTGTSRATGFPRFVITISRPVSATSSISR